MRWAAIGLIGAIIGFLGGMFGKGGSAIATPLLAAVGVPPIIAVASPLPATVPGTLVAYRRFRGGGFSVPRVVGWSLLCGVPATVAGALVTRWIGGSFLVRFTEVVVALLGIRILLESRRPRRDDATAAEIGAIPIGRLAAVATVVGFLAGLLANAGGFLLVPLYLAVLALPIKNALACSLAVSSVLAIPGTIVHAALGHIDWRVTAVFGVASIPLSSIGARTALRMDAHRLERYYGLGLTIMGIALFAAG